MNMIENVVKNSDGMPTVAMDEKHTAELNLLRNFMFRNVYKSNSVKREEDLAKLEVVITSLYNYFLEHPKKLPEDLQGRRYKYSGQRLCGRHDRQICS